IYLWGDNRNSQCCINSSCRFIKQPTKIQSLENKSIKNVFIGTAHTIFSLNDNSYFACGSGFNGQLGSNIAGCTSYPTNFIEISNEEVLDIDVGSFHTIAASAKKFAIFGTISDLPCKNLVFKRSKTNDNQLVFLDLEKANNPMILYITSRGSKYALILAQNADQENMPAITESQMMLRSHKYEKVRPYILTNEILVNSADNDQSLLLCQKILTSPQNMSGSFWIKLLVNESACVSDNEVKELVSIVDMNLIRNSLKQLSGYTQHEYTLTHSFVILSQKLFHCKHIDSVICAIVVFEFPFLGNTKSPNIFMHFHMLKNLFKTIISYSAEKMEFLRQLLLNNDKKYFERAVKLCRIYIEKMLIEMHHRNNVGESNTSATSTLYNFSQNFQSAHIWRFVHSCIKVMEIFYGWNSTLSRNHSISIVNWQLSPELYKYVNLSRDFEKYFKNQRISNQSHDQQDFSYFRYPFLLNTEAKAMVINFDAVYEMQDYLRINNFSDFHSTNLIYQTISNSIEIDRENILETAIDNLQSKSEIDLKKPLIVKFRGEDGEDDGGVAREFFSLVSEEIFSDKNSFFIESENSNLFWFNSS
ncbi:MAG: putative E3 ubiquitin-protein ligase herc4, partial [Marteilia pararefringens]